MLSIKDELENTEQEYEGIKEVINLGKEKGYLLYEEVTTMPFQIISILPKLSRVFYASWGRPASKSSILNNSWRRSSENSAPRQ